MNAPGNNDMQPLDCMDAIETFAGPLKTLTENMDKRLTTSNRAITLAAMESALEGLRIAYGSIKRSQPAEVAR